MVGVLLWMVGLETFLTGTRVPTQQRPGATFFTAESHIIHVGKHEHHSKQFFQLGVSQSGSMLPFHLFRGRKHRLADVC